MEHVCIFIDGSNFYHALKEANLPTNVDFGKLAKALVGPGRKHMQTFYYNTPLIRPRPSDPDFSAREQRYRNQQRFFSALRFVPNMTVRYGRFQKSRRSGVEVVCPSCSNRFRLADATRTVEKGVDVMLATDLLVHGMKGHYDTAILISSDADYKHSVETVKLEFGKTIELQQVEGSRCYDLITASSVYIPITEATIRMCLTT